jgi:hypothetical protein
VSHRFVLTFVSVICHFLREPPEGGGPASWSFVGVQRCADHAASHVWKPANGKLGASPPARRPPGPHAVGPHRPSPRFTRRAWPLIRPSPGRLMTTRPPRLRKYLGTGIGRPRVSNSAGDRSYSASRRAASVHRGGSISRTAMGRHTDSEGRPSEQRLLAKTHSCRCPDPSGPRLGP